MYIPQDKEGHRVYGRKNVEQKPGKFILVNSK